MGQVVLARALAERGSAHRGIAGEPDRISRRAKTRLSSEWRLALRTDASIEPRRPSCRRRGGRRGNNFIWFAPHSHRQVRRLWR